MTKENKGSTTTGPLRFAEKHWSEALCINHWAMAISIFILIITGIYITKPFTIGSGETWQKFLMAHVRFFHLVFGLLLVILFVWRIYLAFFSNFHADWKDFFAWLNPKNTWHSIKFYTLITTVPPEHTGLYGSLQAAAYLFLFFIVFIEAVTGLVLYGALHQAGLANIIYKAFGPVEIWIFGGLAGTRYTHHILTWLFIIFIMIHVYLSFWYERIFKQGIISSIVNGLFFKEAEEHHLNKK
ncbi:MAG: Ni/Fe-hydrogenase, b-type cytochrome subunit [bacterium]